jgi:hypothetical protein
VAVETGQIRPLIGMGADKLLPAVASVSEDSTLGQAIGRRKKAIFETHRRSAVIIGDTPYDIEAARRAGIRAIALRCGGYWSDADLRDAVAILDDPAALLAQWRGDAR